VPARAKVALAAAGAGVLIAASVIAAVALGGPGTLVWNAMA
jgi:hypothetical protein